MAKATIIRKHIKHWLVPHRHNAHRPHLIRRHGLAAVVGILALIQIAPMLTPSAQANMAPTSGMVLGYATDINPVDLLRDTNNERIASGLPVLKLDSRLNSSTEGKARNMFEEDYWAHDSPSGIKPWYWFKQAGYVYRYAGENLAKDFDTSKGTVTGWMNSPGHRANILNANYTDVGFTVMNGTLQGSQTTLVVAHYGQLQESTPAVAAATPVPATPTPAVRSAATAQNSTATPAIATPPASPSISATPTPSESPVVAALATPPATFNSLPIEQNYSLLKPLSIIQTLNIPTLISLSLLVILLIVFAATHTTVWRKKLKRWEFPAYRRQAFFETASVGALILVIVSSGLGSVG